MQVNKKIKVGIGFTTGRKSFQKVLRTYIHTWKESGLSDNKMISLNLFIAYDLNYSKTEITDYTNIYPELLEQIDSKKFIGSIAIKEEINYLISEKVINIKEAGMIFGEGYACKRNAVLYNAIKHNMDYLIFLDDDEYPMAVTNTGKTVIWGGQEVLTTHLKYITHADITHGHHCGYISPIPCIGWIRYKPLLLYITQPECYEEKIKEMWEQLNETLPKICAYFGKEDFNKVLVELEKFHRDVEKHYREFHETQRIWARIMEYFEQHQGLYKRTPFYDDSIDIEA